MRKKRSRVRAENLFLSAEKPDRCRHGLYLQLRDINLQAKDTHLQVEDACL